MLRFLLLMIFCLISNPAQADWPNERPINIIVGAAPGNGPDIIARLAAKYLEKELHQTIIIQNKPGAATSIATNYVIKSNPDGYTILLNAMNIAANTQALKNSNFDINKVLDPIIPIVNSPIVIVVKHGKYNNLQDLITKNTNKQLTYGIMGYGSFSHFLSQHFLSLVNIDGIAIPFKSSAEVSTEIITDRLDLYITSYQAVQGMYTAKDVDILAVISDSRSKFLPEIPTLKELGYPQITINNWSAFFLPAKTPEYIVSAFYDALLRIKNSDDFKNDLSRIAAEPYPSLTREQFKVMLTESQLYYRNLMDKFGMEAK